MKKHSKNDYPIRTLRLLINEKNSFYIEIINKIAEGLNILSSQQDKTKSSGSTKYSARFIS